MNKKLTVTILILIVLAISSACGWFGKGNLTDTTEYQPPPVVLKIAYDAAPTHSIHQSFMQMEQWLEDQSQGRIEVELYPFFALGDDADMLRLLAGGAIQMTLPQASTLAALPEQYSLQLPTNWYVWGRMDGFGLYDNAESAQNAIDNGIGTDMAASLALLDKVSIACLGYAAEGPLAIASVGDPILTPDDLAGKRVAVCGSPEWVAAYEALSAIPISLNLSYIYPALVDEKIDAYQITPEHLATMYLDDYSQNLTITEHAYVFRPLLVDKQWYEGLKKEDASLIDTAVDAFLQQQRESAQNAYKSSIDELSQRGMSIYYLNDEQKQAWNAK